MKLQANARGRTFFALLALALITIGQFMWAQNLGSAPASNVAVQGQTGAQPEGAFLNFINWVGNVIAPVGAGRSLGSSRFLAHRAWLWPVAIRGRSSAGSLRCHATHRVLDHERNRWRDITRQDQLASRNAQAARRTESGWATAACRI